MVNQLRQEILDLVSRYYDSAFTGKPFVPGETSVPVSGRIFDADDLVHLVDASLDFWLTTGRYAEQFESEFARFLGIRHALLCNSGSSANLLALSALTSPILGERQLRPGDEVITVAAGFPNFGSTWGPPVFGGGHPPPHQGHYVGPHLGQPLQPGGGDGGGQTAQSVGDRG